MAEGLNRVTLIGNLGADPELKYTQSGQGVLRLRLATTESYMNRSNERQQRTDWHTVIVWGKRGEALNNILSKGRSICVEGRIQYRQWEDKDGNKRNSTEIVAQNIVLLGSGRGRDSSAPGEFGGGGDGDGGSGGSSGGGGSSSGGGGSTPPTDDFGDDDIPF